MALIKRQLICSIPVSCNTITHAVLGFSCLLVKYIRKFQDEKSPGILQDFCHGCEHPTECSACAVEQKTANGSVFDHLDLLGNARVSKEPLSRIS